MITRARRVFERIIERPVGWMTAKGVSPSLLSLVGLLFTVISAYTYSLIRSFEPAFLYASIFLAVAGLFDAFDGAVARASNRVSIFGSYIDSVLDRVEDSLIILVIVLMELTSTLLGLAYLVGALLVSYSRAKAEALGVKMEGIGVAERGERIILTVLATLLYRSIPNVFDYAFAVLAVLSYLTVIQRMIRTYAALRVIP